MSETELAFVASAGAGGLAVAVAAWAWRLHARLRGGVAAAPLGPAADQPARAALGAFPDIRLRLDDQGDIVEAVAPDDCVAEVARRLGLQAKTPAELVARMAAARPSIEKLAQEGAPFQARLNGPGGAVEVEGRVVAAAAWLRLSPAGGSTAPDPAAEAEGPAARLSRSAPIPMWTVDAGGGLSWANPAWLAETRAVSLEAAIAARQGFERSIDQLVLEAARTGAPQSGFRWAAGDGRRRAWRIVAEPLPLEAGGGALAYALDATDAEETRDTLRRHVEAHDETLNHLADAVAIFGPSKRLAFHNTALQQLFALEAAWLDERPTHAELLDRLRQRRQLPETSDYAAFKAKELDFYGAAQAAPDDSWSLPDGRTLRVVRQPHPLGGMLVIFSDMTDELHLKSRYNAQIQVQRATLDRLNDAVAVFGSDGRLRLHNEAFERFWNLDGDRLEAAGDFDAVAELCRPVLADAALWLGLKARVADPDPESRVPISGEDRTADGRLAAWLTRPLPDGATLVAFSDVTARSELEQALRQREAALAESQALKREFVGSVSYELRTPLTTIVGYSELLEHTPDLPERSRQHAGAIRVAAAQLARSIDDVLDMSQIDAGEMELALERTSVQGLVQAAADRARPRIEGRGARLTVRADRTLGELALDPRRIAQALDHLLDNAALAVGAGGEVGLTAERGSGEVRLAVSDTGRGIPYHLQPNVFDRFVRRERGGPGVGLALVKALAELHGGWAEVQSEPGEGATFILHLPLRAAEAVASPAPAVLTS